TTLCRVDEVVFEVDPSRFDQIIWSDGSTGPTLPVNAHGLYWVEGQSGGCVVRDSVELAEFERNCDCKVFLPNVFSSNDDGINDLFSPQSPCEMVEYELLIANRWGQVVFRTEDPNEGWNGKSRQQMAQAGVYIYWMRYRFSYAAEPELVKGEFVLMR
ncbi:MAG: gliding motility-associated C-terminal domain-containing protein, partial [Saprospiraceae bacterium]|nr:gliding motility-associated C-terminal domain-containing protein [Saprospiraceae bacterium]